MEKAKDSVDYIYAKLKEANSINGEDNSSTPE